MRYIVSLLLVLTAATATAADMTAYGFEIGKPLRLPLCPPGVGTFSTKQIGACLRGGFVVFPVGEGVPHGMLGTRVSGDTLQLLTVLTKGIPRQDFIMLDLKDKYGPPTTTTVETVSNAYGATFQSITAKWQFDGLEVNFFGSMYTLDSGLLLIGTPEGVKAYFDRTNAVTPGRKL